MDISIIIVSFNAKDICTQTLKSLKETLEYTKALCPELEIETLIVDNGSKDGVTEVIEKDFRFAKLIKNIENSGFSKANNLGVKNASNDTKYFLFLNNDIVLDKDSIIKMYYYMESHTNVGIATCRVDLYRGGLDWDCHRAFPTVWNAFCFFTGLERVLSPIFPMVFGKYHLKHMDVNTEHEIDVCLGAFMIIPRYVLEMAGLWPEEYFLNGEDVDLCYRVKMILRLKNMYVPITRIIHYKGASKGTKDASVNYTKASLKTKQLVINSSIGSMQIFYNKYYAKNNNFITNLVVNFGMWALKHKRLILKRE